MNKITLWIVSVWMIAKLNERSLLVMILETNVWDNITEPRQNFLISLKKIELTELPTGCLLYSLNFKEMLYSRGMRLFLVEIQITSLHTWKKLCLSSKLLLCFLIGTVFTNKNPYPKIISLITLKACNAMNWPGGAVLFLWFHHHWLLLYLYTSAEIPTDFQLSSLSGYVYSWLVEVPYWWKTSLSFCPKFWEFSLREVK